MKRHDAKCLTQTRGVLDFVDLTGDVQKAVEASGIADGRVTVFSPHRNCRLVVNEWESGLLFDMKRALQRMSDAPGPQQASIGSNSLMLPVVDRELKLGTWQRVLLVELEGGRRRCVLVQVTGD